MTSAISPLSKSVKLIESNYSLVKLANKDPIVQRLFRPFIQADFASQGYRKDGSPIPPLVSQEELTWLRKTAYLFGLDPSKDLNLPEIPRPEYQPLDMRSVADYVRFEKMRQLKVERTRKRKENSNEKSKQNEIEDSLVPRVPLRFLTKQQRDEVEQEVLQRVEKRMQTMEEEVFKWKEKRRMMRKAAKIEQNKL